MAAKKYLALNAGAKVEVVATITSAGAGNEGDLVALDAAGKLDSSVMPVGIGTDTATIQASETLIAGDFVNIHDSTGARIRKADASNGRRADGFVLAGVTSGANGTVYFEGSNTGRTGLTIGATYYLTTSGNISTTAPTTATHIVQEVGRAISATALSFEPQQPITLA